METRTSWVDLIARGGRRHRPLAKAELLFRQGDRAAAIYVVESGRVRLVRHLEDGSSVTLYTARAGEAVGEAALFADAYHCDAVAETEAQVAALPKGPLLKALTDDARASLEVARLFARQVRDLRARLELRNIRSASARVLAWLRLEADGNPPVVRIDRPWIEVAPELGLTHEAVYRAIAALERTGEIVRTKDAITLQRGASGQAG